MGHICGIYCILNTINNKVYIGSSVNIAVRWRSHRYCLNGNCLTRTNPHLQRAWKKHGQSAFSFLVIEECDELDLLTREQFYIDLCDAYNDKKGYNIGLAVSPMKGKKHKPESIVRISNSSKGKIRNEEYRKNISKSHSMLWRITTPEGRTKTVKNLKEFCRKNELSQSNMWNAAMGNRKSAKGWKVKRVGKSKRMGSWNYRVVRKTTEGDDVYTIREIYYDKEDKINRWVPHDSAPFGESLEELRRDIEYMLAALNNGVLDVDDLPKGEGER